MRRVLVSVGFAVLSLFLFSADALAASKRLTYEEYQGLSSDARQKLTAAYVKKVGTYFEVALDTYLVRCDITAADALALAVKMDEFSQRFSAIFIPPFRITDRPELYVLKTRESYFAAARQWMGGFSPPGWSAGLFVRYGAKRALFACAEYDEQLHNILFHEGTHQLLYYYIGCDFPVWFNEGVATNFEDWDVALSAERNICEEIWKSRHPRVLYDMMTGKGEKSFKPELAKLINSGENEWGRSADPRAYYAMAWGFVNFIIAYGKVGEQYFNKLINGFRAGWDMKKVLPDDERVVLGRQWANYLQSVVVPHVEYCVPIDKAVKENNWDEARKLIAEGLGKYANNTALRYFQALAAAQSGDKKGALETLKKLDKEYPRHPHLTRMLGILAHETGDKINAQKWLKRALTEDYRDEEVRKLLGK